MPIPGIGTLYGVLEADSSDSESCIESDTVFLQGIATLVSLTAERLAMNTHRQDSTHYSESVLDSSPDCVKILSTDGDIEYFNESGLCRMGFASLAQVKGNRWKELWPEPYYRGISATVMAGN